MRDLLRWCLRWFASGEGATPATGGYVLFTVRTKPAHFAVTTKPAHFVTRTKPAHFVVKEP